MNLKKTMSWFASVLLFFPLILEGQAFADGDSDASINGGFFNQLKESKGLVLRVEINARGEENTDSAVLKVYKGALQPENNAAIVQAFEAADDASSQPEITADDISADSSTWGFHRYRYYGWASPYYYYSYTPTYYYYGSYYYPYSSPYYYTTYYYPSYGYRYYYWYY